jgi:micrococcal nuclease
MYEYSAVLVKVVDGDTMHVMVDLGMDIGVRTTLRVYGINAPEMATAEGKAAKTWAIAWFAENCPDGKFVIRTVKDKREKYGRYLATLVAPGGANFNEDIVAAGMAVVYLP